MSNRKSSVGSAPRKSTPQVKLSGDVKPLSDAAKNGQAFGALLGASASQILLHEFGMRNQPTSPASEQFHAAWQRLESALNTRADEPAVSAALRDLNNAYGEALVEMEDRTWHAAWGAVVGIFRGGAR